MRRVTCERGGGERERARKKPLLGSWSPNIQQSDASQFLSKILWREHWQVLQGGRGDGTGRRAAVFGETKELRRVNGCEVEGLRGYMFPSGGELHQVPAARSCQASKADVHGELHLLGGSLPSSRPRRRGCEGRGASAAQGRPCNGGLRQSTQLYSVLGRRGH